MFDESKEKKELTTQQRLCLFEVAERIYSCESIVENMLGYGGGYHEGISMAGVEREVDEIVDLMGELFKKIGDKL